MTCLQCDKVIDITCFKQCFEGKSNHQEETATSNIIPSCKKSQKIHLEAKDNFYENQLDSEKHTVGKIQNSNLVKECIISYLLKCAHVT